MASRPASRSKIPLPARWVFLIPAAAAVAFVSSLLVAVILTLVTGWVGLGAAGWWPIVLIKVPSQLVLGAMFVYWAQEFAPSHRRAVALICLGIVVLLSGGAFVLEMNAGGGWGIVEIVTTLAGGILCAWKLGAIRFTAKPKPVGSASAAAAALAHLVADGADAEHIAVSDIAELVGIDRNDLLAEVRALKAQAGHYALYLGIGESSPFLSVALDRYHAELRSRFGPLQGQLNLVRLKEYAASMSIGNSNEALFQVTPGAEGLRYSGEPLRDVGKLFAYICKAEKNPFVAASGAMLFAATVQESRTMIATVVRPTP